MAYFIDNNHTYYCDKRSDLNSIRIGMYHIGSKFIVLETSEIYIVNPKLQMVLYNRNGSSSNEISESLAELATRIETIETNGVSEDVIATAINNYLISHPVTVVSSDEENKVELLDDGTLSVNSVNTNKLTQTEGESLILDGGDSNEE